MHLISPEELASAIADRLARQPAVLVALDGRCGSGKTTLANTLARFFPSACFKQTACGNAIRVFYIVNKVM